MADLDGEAAQAAAATIVPASLAVLRDVIWQDDIDAAVAATVTRFGQMGNVVNNAGVFDLATIVQITPPATPGRSPSTLDHRRVRCGTNSSSNDVGDVSQRDEAGSFRSLFLGDVAPVSCTMMTESQSLRSSFLRNTPRTNVL